LNQKPERTSQVAITGRHLALLQAKLEEMKVFIPKV